MMHGLKQKLIDAAAIGKEEAGGQNVYVRSVGEALAKLGWQVDLFTRRTDPDAPTVVEHSPYCRTIRLSAGPETGLRPERIFEHLPEFVAAFQQFQAKGTIYPLDLFHAERHTTSSTFRIDTNLSFTDCGTVIRDVVK